MYPVSLTVFIERFRAAVSVVIGPCCPALLKSYSCKCTYCCIIGQINKWWRNESEYFPSLFCFPSFYFLSHFLRLPSVSSGRLIFITRLLFYQSYWHLLTLCASTVSINVCVRTTFHVVTAFCQLTNKRIGYVMLCYTGSPRTELNCSE